MSATASAELEDNPEPTGTVVSTCRSAGATTTPRSSQGADDPGDEAPPRWFERRRFGRAVDRYRDEPVELADDRAHLVPIRRRVTRTVQARSIGERQDEAVVVVGVVAHEVDPSGGDEGGHPDHSDFSDFTAVRPSSILVA